MADDFPLNYADHGGIMASEKYKNKSYTRWVMRQPNPTGGLLEFMNYIVSRQAATSSPEPPASPLQSPYSQEPPATPLVYQGATSASPGEGSPFPGADFSLHRKLDRLERKVDALTQLVRRLMRGEPQEVTPEVPPEVVPPQVPEPSALATLA